MQVFVDSEWNDTANAGRTRKTPARPFVGIAIGTGSEVGMVKANGIYIPSGRVVPLTAPAGYTIEPPENGDLGDNRLARLELFLFEHCGELGADVRRAPRMYLANEANPAGGAGLVIPFENRRHAQITIDPNGGSFTGYQITGTLVNASGATLAEDTGAFTEAITVHVGGTDREEMFQYLTLYVSGGAGNFQYHAQVTGDL